MRKKIWVHTIVFNEENFLWFAVMSIANYVDKILLWDTGSNDKTPQVIEELKKKLGDKISHKRFNRVSADEFTNLRQQMLDETKADWFLVVDGDEVWREDSIKRLVDTIQEKGEVLDSIVVPFYNCLGDIYHYQDEKAGRYKIDDQIGNITIKAINRNIEGLHLQNPYGKEGFFNEKNIALQELDKKRRIYLKAPFLHMSHLQRTSKENLKFKNELGKRFAKDFKLPEVFYMDYPKFIKSPFIKRSVRFVVKSTPRSALVNLKRKIFS